MQRALILHIGTTKTGSTAIQNGLVKNRDALRHSGYYVLQAQSIPNAHTLVPAAALRDPGRAFGASHPMWSGVAPALRLAQFRDELAAELGALPDWAAHCIFSSDLISAWLTEDDDIARLADLFRPYFSNIVIVLYLRRQDQHVASEYNEYLKAGRNVPPVLPKAPGHIRALDYQQLTERYARVFGRAALRPRIFSREDLLNGNAVDDFFAAIGIGGGFETELISNQGLSVKGQLLLRYCIDSLDRNEARAGWRDSTAWRILVGTVATNNHGGGWRPAPAEARAFQAMFATTNEQVRAAYFPNRPSLFNESFADGTAMAYELAPTEAQDAAIAALYDIAAAQAERDAQCYMAQYRLLHRLHDKPGMKAMLARALRLAPESATVRLTLAARCLDRGELVEAETHLLVAERNAAGNPRTRRLRDRLSALRTPFGA